MKGSFTRTICLLAMVLLGACSLSQKTPIPVTPSAPATTPSHFTENETATLKSLKKVDDHPLYTMQYFGEYTPRQASILPTPRNALPTRGWACSLFAVLLDEDHRLYGRNFDWQYSPALLLFTDPPDGYASVSMVDMEYLGFSGQTVLNLTDLPLEELEELLYAPTLPFDGMNEHGLAIGMAAVDPGNMQADPSRETIGSLGVMREILDHARDVDEALSIIKKYNIDFEGGPPLHYLIADANGKSVLVEFYRGDMHVIKNEQPWHFATNFLLSSVQDPRDGGCWRYDRINDRMNEKQGLLDATSAMDLLSEVAQENTQWSVVYQMGLGEVNIAMGRDYSEVHTFNVSDFWNP
jgi:hypothetical protein